mmetsp:Transcript_24139/g.37915  ORF Transcript_24139/g.37915 Transcript_24139/m.37915 type:complete len:86 (+) Transcript_24139:870-1127(+)
MGAHTRHTWFEHGGGDAEWRQSANLDNPFSRSRCRSDGLGRAECGCAAFLIKVLVCCGFLVEACCAPLLSTLRTKHSDGGRVQLL